MPAPPPTLIHALIDRAEATPDTVAVRMLPSGGAATDEAWTWAQWCRTSGQVAEALRAFGVRPGDRVAILAATGLLWPIADLGIQWVGAVAVGLYPTSAPEQIREIVDDTGAVLLFVDGGERLAAAREAAGALPDLRWIVLGDPCAPVGMEQADERERSWTDFLGASSDAFPDALPAPDADALFIYTSGSTGVPKGARLTHRTVIASAESIRDTLGLREGDRMLSFLPFSHAAERLFGHATRVLVGIEAGMVPDPNRVFEAAAQFRPTIFGGLPRFYEKIWEAEVAERGPAAPTPSPVVERMTGGQVRRATSGGAPLPIDVARGLDGLGLTVLGGYGLTEHLCAAFNRPDDVRFDDVGPAMRGSRIRIADDGEIQVRRSALTFSGYHGRPDETADAFTPDGAWLRTGDLGTLTLEGRLRVTGRIKELIALSTGKKVAPLRIEAALVEQPWIEHGVLVGEGRKFVTALITLGRTAVEAWAREEGIGLPDDGLEADPRVRAEVERQVAEVNRTLSRTESVRKFDVLPTRFSIEGGELTPTLKIRREVILERWAARIDALYSEDAR